jgi:hypothetical protein
MHPPLSQHAQMRRAHAPNCLLFLQHFQISRRFLTQRRCSRCLLLRRCDCHASHRHSAHRCQRCSISAHPSILRHAHHHIEQLTLSPQHPKLRDTFLTSANAPQALATPLVGAAVHFAHCPQHCSVCPLFVRRMCTANSSPVRQQQSTQGSGASQHHFSSRRSLRQGM